MRHRLEGFRRLVEVHDLHDREIVVGAHYAGDHPDDGEREQTGLDRREKHVELGEEARERRDASHRKQQHREKERHGRLGPCQAREVRYVLNHLSAAAHRQDAGERSKGHGDVNRHIDEDALHALLGAGGKPHQRVAHVADRGIGHQALDVALADGRE